MPLNAYKRKNGVYYIRGKHHGRPVDQSARTRVKSVAEAIAEKLEREIFEEVVLGKQPERTFAEAAVGYMETDGERKYLKRILAAPVLLANKQRAAFGAVLLKDIDQELINQVAAHIHPNDADSTRNRQVLTPIAYVLNYASEQPTWGYKAFRMRRPKQPKGRLDWRMPEEIEWWIANSGHVAPLITAYAGTGARASELVHLSWENVSPDAYSFTLWEEDTKAGVARSVTLQRRVREALPSRTAGRVWRNSKGAPWHDYDAINLHLYKVMEAEVERRADREEREAMKTLRSAQRSWKRTKDEQSQARTALRQMVETVRVRTQTPKLHLHALRHTWATWAYAVTRDINFVMEQGGWASEKLALRYIHGATPDLARRVKAHGWEIDARTVDEPVENKSPIVFPEGASNQ